jgi:ubiquitin carboxyl-terminal hydrolase MINDY-1/2
MVTRKPLPAGASLAPAANPPYPTTPLATTNPSPFRMQDAHSQLRSQDSEQESDNPWSDDEEEEEEEEEEAAPPPKELPESLRVGPPKGSIPETLQEKLTPQHTSTNPFIQRQHSGGMKESSADAWGEKPAPTSAPPPPPIPNGMHFGICNEYTAKIETATPPPTEQFANLSVSEPSTNPWQPALNEKKSQPPSLHREDSGNAAWSAAPPARQAPAAPPIDSSQPVLIDLEEPESPAWDEDEASPVVHEMPAETVNEAQQMNEDAHAWDGHQGHTQQNPPANNFLAVEQGEGWNIVDHEATGQQSGVISGDGTVLERYPTEEDAPALPPRRSQEQPPPQPPRPTIVADNPSESSITSPTTKKQRKETYEIKRITWHDVTTKNNPRVSPILTQNANGPCPLLALVNALTLSTPADVETALVDTLRSREQVSLGLLLDAVFDELMSGRRGDAAQALPDVSDLYSFLITLHTGMNVNPRFVPPPPTKSANDPRNSMSHLHPSEREGLILGTFEDTREMKLYSTFSIPLIHGWLPEFGTREYTALHRSAQSYEDAQNIMFHEEGLEDKLQHEGLSFEEQATLEDIATIKAFFASNATQLTPYGLQTITTSLAPGAVAILFRNDHFSTLYRHPDTLQLLQLVTDMGYAGHEEVVWQSLVDVNDENAEFFSGDFRLVGGAPQTPSASTPAAGPSDNWTTVPSRRSNTNQNQNHRSTPSSSSHNQPPQSPNTEQEDHDLALALQLQEEEEERHRAELARRRRETELSQQYIEQQGREPNNSVPVSTFSGGRGRGGNNSNNNTRGSGNSNNVNNAPQEARPAIPPRRNNTGGNIPVPVADPEAGVADAPPSYEQAATQAAYVPPSNHPAHPSTPLGGVSGGVRGGGRRMSAYSANAQNVGYVSPVGRVNTGGRRGTLIDQIPQGSGIGRRNTAGSGGGERERECVIM